LLFEAERNNSQFLFFKIIWLIGWDVYFDFVYYYTLTNIKGY